MTLSLKRIFLISLILTKISEEKLPVKTAYRLSKILSKIAPELSEIEKARMKLVEKYGEKNEKETVVSEKNMEVFKTEYMDFLNQDIDLDMPTLQIDYLDDVKLSVTDINILGDILTEKKEN